MITSDDDDRLPFNLPHEVIQDAYAASSDRPAGQPRYVAFAYNVEVALARRRVRVDPVLLPIFAGYQRLMWHAMRMHGCLGSALEMVDRDPRMDVRPGREVMREFQDAFMHSN